MASIKKMASINGNTVLHFGHLVMMEQVRLMFPRPVKPSPGAGAQVKGLAIANIKRNPDYPMDKGSMQNLIIQTCEFERVAVFENPNKVNCLFKCKSGDDKTNMFIDIMEKFDERIVDLISSDGVNYPRNLGGARERYRPILKHDEYMGQVKLEVRAEIPLQNGSAKDTMFFEMLDDGPVQIDFAKFMESYKHRPVVAIIEFPYMTVMNSGTKSISVKPIVKQVLMMPETKTDDMSVQDNNSFRFIDM